jgi:sporulation protein YlmC with PRC-barrel domain
MPRIAGLIHSKSGSRLPVLALLVAASLSGGAALAQGGKADAGRSDRLKSEAKTAAAMAHKAGEWRASKLAGLDVYNEGNEKIGDISDLIVDRSGKVTNVVIGVGGFLGVGERYVAVSFDKLKWSDVPVREAKAGDTGTSAPATNVDSNAKTASEGGARTTGAAGGSSRGVNWYPDHAVLNATRDQLKAMPEFKY